MHRQLAAFVDRQAAWADPVADRVQPLLTDLFRDRRSLKSALNGTWFGHPVHPALTDVPTGALTLAVLFDFTGHDDAADTAVAVGIAAMAAAAVTGVADAVDAYDKPRTYASIHATVMTASLGAYLLSFLLRLGPGFCRPAARLLGYLGYGAMTAGAYVGGDLVFRAGNQVDRHAFDSASAKWKDLDVTAVPAGKLVKAKAGNDTLVLYREVEGDPISAFHAVCSHAGGPLDRGEIVDGCVQCPWHGSRFDLETGEVRQGPAVYDQPRFEVRETADGGLQARRLRDAVPTA
jgi:nitrite reductase/ring-hydroxylating ferredoxin subunit/uncharacterized membrane protein